MHVPRDMLFSKTSPCNQHTTCTVNFKTRRLVNPRSLRPIHTVCRGEGAEREVFVSITPSSWSSPPLRSLWQSLQFVRGEWWSHWRMMLHDGELGDWCTRVTFYILYSEARQVCLAENAHLPHISWELSCPGKRKKRRSEVSLILLITAVNTAVWRYLRSMWRSLSTAAWFLFLRSLCWDVYIPNFEGVVCVYIIYCSHR
jgi:hypothetical protein